MANVNKPRGFVRPKRDDGTAAVTERQRVGQNTELFKGQPVKMVSGRIVALANDHDPVWGVMAQYVKTGAGETKEVDVTDVRDTTFEATTDATGGPVTDASVGLYFAVLNFTTGTAGTGESLAVVDADTGNAVATGLAVQMEEPCTREGNDNAAANNCIRVRFLRLQRGQVNS